MTKQKIEVDVPEGYTICKIDYFEDEQFIKVRIKEKIQPRRRVIEETDVDDSDISFYDSTAGAYTFWREVKETDIPLTKGEPKKSLSVADAKELLNYLPSNTDFYKDLIEFIEENHEA